MKKSIALSLFITVSPLVLSGCSYDHFVAFSEHEKGTLITPAQLSSLVPGQTRISDARLSLGDPTKVQRKAGRELWAYSYQRFNSNPMVTSQNSSEVVYLEFDSKGVLAKRWRKELRDDGDE